MKTFFKYFLPTICIVLASIFIFQTFDNPQNIEDAGYVEDIKDEMQEDQSFSEIESDETEVSLIQNDTVNIFNSGNGKKEELNGSNNINSSKNDSGEKNDSTVTDKKPTINEYLNISKAEWMYKLLNAVELNDIEVSDIGAPFQDIANHKYEKSILIAYKLGMLPDLQSNKFKPNDDADREFVAVTAVKSLGIIPNKEIECDDSDTIEYKGDVASAIDFEIFKLENNKFNPDKKVKKSEADIILEKVIEIDNYVIYDGTEKEEIVYKDGVILFDDEISYNVDKNIVIFNDTPTENFEEGSIFILPNNTAYKVVSTKIENNKYEVITTSPEIYEVISSIDAQGKALPDFSNIVLYEGATIIPSVSTYDLDIGAGQSSVSVKYDSTIKGIPVSGLIELRVNGVEYSIVSSYYYTVNTEHEHIDEAYLNVDWDADISVSASMPDEYKEGELEIDICEIPFAPLDPTASITLVGKLKMEVNIDGEVTVGFEIGNYKSVKVQQGKFIEEVAAPQLDNTFIDRCYVDLKGELGAHIGPLVGVNVHQYNIISAGILPGIVLTVDQDIEEHRFCTDVNITFDGYVEAELITESFKSEKLWEISLGSPHFESCRKVDKCTYEYGKMGQLQLSVLDYISNKGVSLADVYIEGVDNDYAETFRTDRQGYLALWIPAGNYEMTVKEAIVKDEENSTENEIKYIEYQEYTCQFKITVDDITRCKAELMPLDVDGVSTVEGYIFDETSLEKISFANIQICESEEFNPDEVAVTITASKNGEYRVPLRIGRYSVRISADDYITTDAILDVRKIGDTIYQDFFVSPENPLDEFPLEYAYNADFTATVIKSPFYDQDKTYRVNIPDIVTLSGQEYKVTGIHDKAFERLSNIISLKMGDNITSIGNESFSNCSNLRSIYLPNNLTSIGEAAFASCSSLKEVTISESVTNIGKWAFKGCNSINYINIKSEDLVCGSGCFSFGNVEDLQVILPTSMTKIPDYLLYENTSPISIILPNGITEIGNSAFRGCKELEKIILPDSLEFIGEAAFAGCSKLQGITIPQKVNTISSYAFNDCNNISYINVNALSFNSSKQGAFEFNNPNGLTVNLTQKMTKIPEYFLKGNKSNINISLHEGITEIGSAAFSGCVSIKNIKLPNTIKEIHSDAFRWCESLEKIEFPHSLTTIRAYAFQGCTSLTEITIPNTITDLGSYSFHECDGISVINYYSNNIQELTNVFAFDNPNGLKVTLGANISFIPVDFLKFNTSDIEITLHEGITDIGNCAFAECTGLKYITIPASVDRIGYKAFENTGITTIVFKGKIDDIYINENAFSNTAVENKINNPIGSGSICDIGHVYVLTEIVEPTEKDYGHEMYKCLVCNDSYSNLIYLTENQKYSYKYIKFNITGLYNEENNSDAYADIAEIYLYDEHGNELSYEDLSVSASSYVSTYPINNIIDKATDTFWRSENSDNATPHWLILCVNPQMIGRIDILLPDTINVIDELDIQLSQDAENWIEWGNYSNLHAEWKYGESMHFYKNVVF